MKCTSSIKNPLIAKTTIRTGNSKEKFSTLRISFDNTNHRKGTTFLFIFQLWTLGFIMSILFAIVTLNIFLGLGLAS